MTACDINYNLIFPEGFSVWLKQHFFIPHNQRNLSGKWEKWQGRKGLKDRVRVFVFDSADSPKNIVH